MEGSGLLFTTERDTLIKKNRKKILAKAKEDLNAF